MAAMTATGGSPRWASEPPARRAARNESEHTTMSELDIIESFRHAMTAIGASPAAVSPGSTTYDKRAALGDIGAAFTRACDAQPGLDAIRAVSGPGAVVVRVGTAVLVNLDRPTPGLLVARVLAAAQSAIGTAESFNLVVFGRQNRGIA